MKICKLIGKVIGSLIGIVACRVVDALGIGAGMWLVFKIWERIS